MFYLRHRSSLQSMLCNAISASVYGMDAHRLQGEVDVGTGRIQDLPEELPLTACQPQRHRQIEEKVRQVRSGSTVMEDNGTNGLFA